MPRESGHPVTTDPGMSERVTQHIASWLLDHPLSRMMTAAAIVGASSEPSRDHRPAGPARAPPLRFDLSWPILIGFAAVLCVLIVLPMSWLVYLQRHRQGRRLHARQFRRARHRSDLRRSADHHRDPGDLLGRHLLRGRGADGLAGGAHRHAAAPHRARAGDRLVRDAAVPRRDRLGAAGRAEQRAPQQDLPRRHRRAAGRATCSTSTRSPGLIFVISCYTFPYVFVLVANALDRIPGDLEDASSILGGSAWTTARRVTIPLALPALLAGALVAFLQAMTLFGSPAILAIPAGFHTMTTKIWSLFQYPPKPAARRRRLDAAAGADRPAAARRERHPRPARLCGGRRPPGRPAPGAARRLEMGRARRRLRGAVQPGVPALWRAAQRRLLAGRVAIRHARDRHAAQHQFRVLRTLRHQARVQEHADPVHRDRHHRHR